MQHTVTASMADTVPVGAPPEAAQITSVGGVAVAFRLKKFPPLLHDRQVGAVTYGRSLQLLLSEFFALVTHLLSGGAPQEQAPQSRVSLTPR